MKKIIILIAFISLCFGGNRVADLLKDRIQQLPPEIQKQILKKTPTWKNIPSRQLNRSMMDPSDLYGEWEFQDADATMWLTVGTDQTIPNFMQIYGMEPAEGGIVIFGTAVDTMDYMILWSFYGYSFLIVSNIPISNMNYYGYDENFEFPFYAMIYSSDNYYNWAEFIAVDTVGGDTLVYEFENEADVDSIFIDTTTFRVDITNLTFSDEYNYTGVSFTLNGSLTPGTIDLVAGVPIELPFFSEGFGPDSGAGESYSMQFFGDGTGYEFFSGFDEYYYEEWTDTTEFDWSATNDSITFIFYYFDEYYYEENSDTTSLAYAVENNSLTLEAEFDFCDMMDDDYYYYYYYDSVDCYEMFGDWFGITDVQDITMEFWMEMSYVGTVSIADAHDLQSGEFKLHQAYPNPFNPITTLQYEMGSAGPVSIQVYDVNGRTIRTLYNDINIPGKHEIRWDAKDDHGRGVSSGVYLFKVNVDGKVQTAKMLLLK